MKCIKCGKQTEYSEYSLCIKCYFDSKPKCIACGTRIPDAYALKGWRYCEPCFQEVKKDIL